MWATALKHVGLGAPGVIAGGTESARPGGVITVTRTESPVLNSVNVTKDKGRTAIPVAKRPAVGAVIVVNGYRNGVRPRWSAIKAQ